MRVTLAPAPPQDDLFERFGIKPLAPQLLQQALTHASSLNEADPTEASSNERFEFLGDAILGMIVADTLCKWFPAAGEGELTRLRADVVRGSTLAEAARRLDLGERLVMGRGEEGAGGRTRNRNLAGALEALVAAVYLGHGYRAARSFVLRLLEPEMKRVRREGALLDPKSTLQHLVQTRWHEPPEYVTVEEAPAGERGRFTVEVRAAGATLGRGSGASKREAQRVAAAEAVIALAEVAVDGA